jgi:hypothetical protein
MSPKIWRTLLNFEYIERGPTAGKSLSDAKSSKLRQTTKEFLLSCLDATSLAQANELSATLVWNERVVDQLNPLTDQEKEEIVWELTELNFRSELLSLDSMLRSSTSSPMERQGLVAECFVGCSTESFFVADLKSANLGLGDKSWEARVKYILSMRRLMREWSSEALPPIITKVKTMAFEERDIIKMEQAVAQVYTQAFYNHFHRAPIVPRRLSHNAFSTPPSRIDISGQTLNLIYYPIELQ